jgi:hypothetical protein
VPGYSCSNATKVNATRSPIGRHRHVQSLRKASPLSFLSRRVR